MGNENISYTKTKHMRNDVLRNDNLKTRKFICDLMREFKHGKEDQQT